MTTMIMTVRFFVSHGESTHSHCTTSISSIAILTTELCWWKVILQYAFIND